MLYANHDGTRVTATPRATAACPSCGASLVAKCGRIKLWHWAHTSADCDPWFEPESEWHLGWKKALPPEQCEVVIGPHRADAVVQDRLGRIVVEFQRSPISVGTIAERESFYGRMLWVFDCVGFTAPTCGCPADAIHHEWCAPPRIDLSPISGACSAFHWRWPRASLEACRRPVFLDFGTFVLWVREHSAGFRSGWGSHYQRASMERALAGSSGTFVDRLGGAR